MEGPPSAPSPRAAYEAQVIVIDLGGAGAESLLTGAMPVSGTFWQATQPVSGTVTVNAGTGTFGVSGSVAVSNFPATQPVSGTFWQATQPVSIATTVTVTGAGGTFPVTGTVAATQSGTWNVGSITTLPALAAGTNLIGQVSASDETGTVYSGTTACTPKFATFSTSSSGATTVVAAVAGKRIRVLRWRCTANGATNVKWQSHCHAHRHLGPVLPDAVFSGGRGLLPGRPFSDRQRRSAGH